VEGVAEEEEIPLVILRDLVKEVVVTDQTMPTHLLEHKILEEAAVVRVDMMVALTQAATVVQAWSSLRCQIP
jgi:hypothetical protein